MEKFNSKVTDVTIKNPPGFKPEDNFDTNSELRVLWWFEAETRESGIKAMNHGVELIEGEIEVSLWTEGEDDTTEIEFSSKTFEIKDEMAICYGALYPEEIEIDFKQKTITIS